MDHQRQSVRISPNLSANRATLWRSDTRSWLWLYRWFYCWENSSKRNEENWISLVRRPCEKMFPWSRYDFVWKFTLHSGGVGDGGWGGWPGVQTLIYHLWPCTENVAPFNYSANVAPTNYSATLTHFSFEQCLKVLISGSAIRSVCLRYFERAFEIPKWQCSLPFCIPQLLKSLPFICIKPEKGKKKGMEEDGPSPYIVHYR